MQGHNSTDVVTGCLKTIIAYVRNIQKVTASLLAFATYIPGHSADMTDFLATGSHGKEISSDQAHQRSAAPADLVLSRRSRAAAVRARCLPPAWGRRGAGAAVGGGGFGRTRSIGDIQETV